MHPPPVAASRLAPGGWLEGWEITPNYQPASEVGGDFYDFFELEDGRLGVVVGDATGKGIPAALVESATSSMLRAAAQALGTSSPGEVLAQVNEALLARIPPNMFVTCFYAIVDPKSGRLRYANAGRDLPYLRRRSGDDAEELRARGMPLGLMRARRKGRGNACPFEDVVRPLRREVTGWSWASASSRGTLRRVAPGYRSRLARRCRRGPQSRRRRSGRRLFFDRRTMAASTAACAVSSLSPSGSYLGSSPR
jgi:hypothetical protein